MKATARDPRLHDDAGAAHAVGHRPPQAPRALRPRGRPALAARRATATASSGRCSGFVHAHVGWMFTNLGMEQGRIYGKDLYEDRLVRTIDRLYLLWVVADARRSPSRSATRSAGVAARGRGPGLGRARADLPLPARDVQRQLDLPHVRPPRLPRPRRVAQQLADRRCSSSARAGTTTTTPSPPRPATGCAASRSTSPGG